MRFPHAIGIHKPAELGRHVQSRQVQGMFQLQFIPHGTNDPFARVTLTVFDFTQLNLKTLTSDFESLYLNPISPGTGRTEGETSLAYLLI